jgi:tripartite ATP-independent transporter DctM subunit
MASILTESGLVSELFSAIEKWIGRLPGSLAIATIIAGTAFGAVSGSTLAAAAAFAKAATPAMRKYGYDDVLSLGSVAAASNMSFLIPPSIFFVIYGIIVEISIGKLFIAGILPGLLLMLLCIGVVLLHVLKTKGSAIMHHSYTWKERFSGLKVIGIIGLIAFVVLGSIYLGVCTPTESAALGSLGSVVAFILLKKANWISFTKSLIETLKTTGMLFILLIGAQVFSSMLTLSEIPLWIMKNLTHGNVSPIMFLLLVMIIYLIFGCFFEIVSIIIIFAPIFHPLLTKYGFDPVVIGVMSCIAVLIGQLSPPFGLMVYTVAGLVPDTSVPATFKASLPYLIATLLCLVIVGICPEIILFLPKRLGI